MSLFCAQEERALKQQIFGSLALVADDDYIRIYRSTGIEIDSRRDVIQNHILSQIEGSVKRFVNFVKSIPGFTQLPMEDQIVLVKGTRRDVLVGRDLTSGCGPQTLINLTDLEIALELCCTKYPT